MNILVVTSCTGKKIEKPDNQLIQEDFSKIDRLKEREEELVNFRVTAGKMYKGMQHLRLMEGIDSLREKYGEDIVDLKIVSAGYGLIDEAEEIVPYGVTFNTMKAREADEWSTFLNIKEDLEEAIKEYDIVIFLLGDKYLRSLKLPIDNISDCSKLVFLASKSSRKRIPNKKPYYFLEVGQKDAKSFSYGLVGLKGYLFKLFAQEILGEGKGVFEQVYKEPNLLLDRLEKYRIRNLV